MSGPVLVGDPPPAVLAYFRHVNSEQWAAVGALFAPGAELRAVGTRVRRGPDDIAAYFPRALAGYPQHLDEPTRVVTAADVCLVEITFIGRTPAGADVTFDAVDVFDLHEGLITRLTSWYDTAAVHAAVAGSH